MLSGKHRVQPLSILAAAAAALSALQVRAAFFQPQALTGAKPSISSKKMMEGWQRWACSSTMPGHAAMGQVCCSSTGRLHEARQGSNGQVHTAFQARR